MADTFTHSHYVPTLKWRQGEYKALASLAGDVRTAVTPLLEVPAISWDYEEDRPQKTIDQHLAQIPQQIEANWGTEHAFIDCDLVSGERLQNQTHPLKWLTEQASHRGLSLIPVTALDRDQGYQAAVGDCAFGEERQVALRFSLDEVLDDQTPDALDALVAALKVNIQNIHAIIDLQYLDGSTAPILLAVLPKALKALTLLNAARTLTLLGTAFPIDLSDVNPGVGAISRAEWALWLSLRSKNLSRMPSFGDYAVAHFDSRELDPRTMRVSASIRYTGKDEWHIFRGHWLRSPHHSGFDQFRDLSTAVVNHPEYSGKNFSWGDEFISKCADGSGGTGNLSQWRQVANSHHLTYVVRQIANLP